MKCQRCGAEVEKTGRTQKYCLTCATLAAREHQKIWRESKKASKPARHCRICGAVIGSYRRLCDDCFAQHRRDYHHERYLRKVKIKKEVRK